MRRGGFAVLGCLSLVSLALVAPSGAVANASQNGEAKDLVGLMVDAHNDNLQAVKLFQKQFDGQYTFCKEVEGIGRPEAWVPVEILGSTDQTFSNEMYQYNRGLLKPAVATLGHFKLKLNAKDRKNFNLGLKRLKMAIDLHGHGDPAEFPQLGVAGDHLIDHDCHGFLISVDNAAIAGIAAWHDERAGLQKIVDALGMDKDPEGGNAYPDSPYGD
jgi:hypothetical protein